MQSKDFTDIDCEPVGQVKLKLLPLPCVVLVHEGSTTEDILDTAIGPTLACRKTAGDLVCLKYGDIPKGDTSR